MLRMAAMAGFVPLGDCKGVCRRGRCLALVRTSLNIERRRRRE